jgi:hypothetical protein
MIEVFDRRENKYVVPKAKGVSFIAQMEDFAIDLGLDKEYYPNCVNRTLYYFPNDINGFYPGFGVRYRDYANGMLDEVSVNEGTSGSYEIKCTDGEVAGVKKKIKINAPFQPQMTIAQLKEMILSSKTNEDTKGWFLGKLAEQHLKDEQSIEPFTGVSYRRARYKKNNNVYSVDKDLTTFAIERNNGEINFIRTKEYGDVIFETKEVCEDNRTRWQVYRNLVSNDAARFYSKKGESLNQLHYYRVAKLVPKTIESEIKGEEMELKLNIQDTSSATQILGRLYEKLEEISPTGFNVCPDQPFFSSQSTVNAYYYDQDNPEKEAKMLMRMGRFKFASKEPSDGDGVAKTRKEDKGVVFDNTRQAIRESANGMIKAGTVVRTRNSFWIYSPEGRCFKVSMDINRKLPYRPESIFCQLEVEYTGKRIDSGEKGTKEDIQRELSTIKSFVTNFLDVKGYVWSNGGRKVDILRNGLSKENILASN